MSTTSLRLVLCLAALALCAVAAPEGGLAHPPDAPFDQDSFSPPIQQGELKVKLETVASGLAAPVKAVAAPGLRNYLFVVDQPGTIWSVNLKTGSRSLFLDARDRVAPLGVFGPGTFDEKGLLGLAFDPGFRENGLFYTYLSATPAGQPTFPTTIPADKAVDHQNVVARWRAVDPRQPTRGVDSQTYFELMRVDWPSFAHNGGDLAFGPDGMLYIPMGEGGGHDDQDGQLFLGLPIYGHQGNGNAQKLNTPLGKILRIDVNGDSSANGRYGIPPDNPFVDTGTDVVKEIYALGFRNPWRMSFDSETGALYVGNVGQNDLEEVERVVRGGNYGWNLKEGTFCFDPGNFDANSGTATTTTTCPASLPPGLIDPIAQYDTHTDGHSVVGGYVYRGHRFEELRGRYVFGEFSRLFNSRPGGAFFNNYGRLLYTARKVGSVSGLMEIKEFRGFPEEAQRLGLTAPDAPPAAFKQTVGVLGMGEDARGEIYATGNVTGFPSGSDGVVLRLALDDD
jgi:glucose/arabinose dehydrogenase